MELIIIIVAIVAMGILYYLMGSNLKELEKIAKDSELNEIASKYNGGGHKFASGVRTESHEVIENLLNDLKNLCKEYSEKEK